jgi:hypothetical protein
MLPLSALKVIHALLNAQKPLSLRDLSKEASVPLSICSRHITELDRLGYVRKRPQIRVVNQEIVYFIAYARPLRSLESSNFETLDRAQYLISKIADLAGGRLDCAYTHLAGAELVAPYVVPTEVYVYIRNEQLPEWKAVLETSQIYPGQNGSVHLVTSELDPFQGAREVRGAMVVSNHLLFADLFSCGGREREAARFLAERVGLNV